MKREIEVFFTALRFYTRLPCPDVKHSQEYLNEATRYFPLIGCIVGSICAAAFVITHQLFSLEISIVLTMIVGVLMTGAFHEDGWADTCDGFGGGFSKSQILTIMKDSRIGTYGAIGLVLILLLKFIVLTQIQFSWIPLILITAQALSRWVVTVVMCTYQYSRENEDSKAKPLAKALSIPGFCVASLFGLFPLLFFHQVFIFVLIFPALISALLIAHYFFQRIDGYTGDCLGAIQQFSEIIIYLSFILLWKFI